MTGLQKLVGSDWWGHVKGSPPTTCLMFFAGWAEPRQAHTGAKSCICNCYLTRLSGRVLALDLNDCVSKICRYLLALARWKTDSGSRYGRGVSVLCSCCVLRTAVDSRSLLRAPKNN